VRPDGGETKAREEGEGGGGEQEEQEEEEEIRKEEQCGYDCDQVIYEKKIPRWERMEMLNCACMSLLIIIGRRRGRGNSSGRDKVRRNKEQYVKDDSDNASIREYCRLT
jgi:hypothetical protein